MMTIEELNELPDERLRVMCAEALGLPKTERRWRFRLWGNWSQGYHNREHAETEAANLSREGHIIQDLCEYDRPVEFPNYPADLNAMAEAERLMTEDECKDFNHALMDAKPPRRDIKHFSERWTWGSTARQRCIAFIAVKQTGEVEA